MQDMSERQSAHPSADGTPPVVPPSSGPGERGLPPRQGPDHAGIGGATGTGLAGADTPPSYVFALGRIEARSPSLAVEKEFAQSTGRAGTAGLTDRQALQRVLSDRRNRYLARQ